MPPRHGKTRTLVLFSTWILGKDQNNKIITTAYNDDLAIDFSKYTRDTISEIKNKPIEIVYSDIFKNVKVKYGDASMKNWALDGQFFNFKGSGIGGTITGKGGNKIIVDDPVKSAEEAFNETHLEKLWVWYTGTLLSRKEHGAQIIICHTPWSKKDIGGRLRTEQSEDCHIFSLPAKLENGKMLCSEILDEAEYDNLEKVMEPLIFSANYKMKRLDVKGLLYGNLKTYDDFPTNDKGEYLPRTRKSWCDTADQGTDYLCHIIADICKDFVYIVDVYYTKEDVTITEERIADKIIEFSPTDSIFESNAGGHAIAMHIKKILESNKHFKTVITTRQQRQNKIARILSNAKLVSERILFPMQWKYLYPEYYSAMTTFMKEGKNKNDDGPDCTTMIAEDVFNIPKLTLNIRQRMM
jgi:predicted phage terminase large subunit-like protein